MGLAETGAWPRGPPSLALESSSLVSPSDNLGPHNLCPLRALLARNLNGLPASMSSPLGLSEGPGLEFWVRGMELNIHLPLASHPTRDSPRHRWSGTVRWEAL